MKVTNFPAFKILLPYIAGILIQSNFQIEIVLWQYILFFVAIFLFSYSIPYLKQNFRFTSFFPVTLMLLMFFTGIEISRIHSTATNTAQLLNKSNLYVAEIITEPSQKTKSVKVIANMLYMRNDSMQQSCNEKVLLYFENDTAAANLRYGEVVVFTATFNNIENSGNPHEFNYKALMLKEGVTLQAYLAYNKWKKTGKNNGIPIFRFFIELRQKLMQQFRNVGIEHQEHAVLSALTLGYQDDLNDDIRNAYIASGAMHILSVSGLHVGIVFLVIQFFLSFLNRNRYTKIVKAIISLSALWAFAFLSGLSPSVIRASVMLSFVVVGMAAKWYISIYNSIASSAMIMLLFKPAFLFSVGFLLSYFAVISIVFFYSYFYELKEFKHKLLDKAWSLLCVSVAAQIGTLPISLYYFHIFPTYFFITNLLVIELSGLILPVTIIFFIAYKIPYIADWIGFVLEMMVKLLNYIVQFVESIPFSTIDFLAFNGFETIVSYVSILFFGYFIVSKRKRYLNLSLAILLVVFTSKTFQQVIHAEQKVVTVYNSNKNSLINFINGNKNYLLCDSTTFTNKKTISFAANNYWVNIYAKKPAIYLLSDTLLKFQEADWLIHKSIVKFHDKTFYLLNSPAQIQLFGLDSNTIAVDYLIISGNLNVKLTHLQKNINFKEVIFDSSNSFYRIEKWKTECQKLHFKYFNVKENGAYILHLGREEKAKRIEVANFFFKAEFF